MGMFKRKRAGVALERDTVREIKEGRKKLRKELRAKGIKSKQEFEMVAGGLGLYFDKRGFLIPWLFHGRGLMALAGALAALLGAVFMMSTISQMKGHFTINLSGGMFREGFTLSDTVGFENPSTVLFCEPAADVPCISISQIPEDIDDYDGQHNAEYFAYTFYCRNEGESIADYVWDVEIVDESLETSEAVWMMVFEDGKMIFYAEANERTGKAEALGDSTRAYPTAPLIKHAQRPDEQYEVIKEKNGVSYYRLIPVPFKSDTVAASGLQEDVAPMDVHKYTVVFWLEGDDPDCTNDKIGGHLGLTVQFRLLEESDQSEAGENKSWWSDLWKNLRG